MGQLFSDWIGRRCCRNAAWAAEGLQGEMEGRPIKVLVGKSYTARSTRVYSHGWPRDEVVPTQMPRKSVVRFVLRQLDPESQRRCYKPGICWRLGGHSGPYPLLEIIDQAILPSVAISGLAS